MDCLREMLILELGSEYIKWDQIMCSTGSKEVSKKNKHTHTKGWGIVQGTNLKELQIAKTETIWATK